MANSDSGSFLAGFLVGGIVGGIVGGVVGVLLAPKSGAQTRAELMEHSEVWRTRAEEVAARVRERVSPAMEGMRERVSPAMETVRSTVGPVAETVAAKVGRRSADGQGEAVAAAAETKPAADA